MKNGTSVLELTIPTRTLCASAPLARSHTGAARHATSIKRVQICIASSPVTLSTGLQCCTRHTHCKVWRPETFFHANARPGRQIEMEAAMTDAALATPAVTANDTIRTKGILHFTIGVRDHNAAAKWYSEILGCRHMRSTERYAFMECGGSYF